jgi:hypothetical protein
MESCLQVLERQVSEAMNETLLQDFSKEEVQATLFQMAPLKAPSPDGFSTGFFQDNWATVKEEICDAILMVLKSGSVNLELNFTYLALIPKNNNPFCVLDFRSISLCNVLYKIISKVLVIRLKVILLDIISPTQSAFILG